MKEVPRVAVVPLGFGPDFQGLYPTIILYQ